MRERRQLVAFNRGLISKQGLARIDLSRMAMAAEEQKNWIPRVLGSMMLRPGWEYLHSTKGDNTARYLDFIFNADDYALIEMTDSVMRVVVDDELVTRSAVSAAVTNGAFTSDISGWTDADEGGSAASTWETGGYAELLGDGTNSAILRQEVTVTETGTEHGVRITVEQGPVVCRIGSSAGEDDYLAETSLGTGVHSLAITPTGNFFIDLRNVLARAVLVDSVEIEAAGILELATPYAEANLDHIRYDQSADVIFLACYGIKQKKIERRSTASWSLVDYEPQDGPFRIQNVTPTTIAPSALTGDITLTASKPVFSSGHVGALFRVQSSGQEVSADVSSEDSFTDAIRVVGTGEDRRFSIRIQGTWSGTVTVQYSVGEEGSWVDDLTYSGNTSAAYVDGQDEQIIYYRIGIKAGDYTSGTATLTLSYANGSRTGVARVTGCTSDTVVDAYVIENFGGTDGTATWWEGVWSDYRGYPSSVALFEGRLWWAGADKIIGSESDKFNGFDDEIEGDSAPIQRNIGEGPVDQIHWLLPLGRLCIGTASNSALVDAKEIKGNNILAARSSSFDEPLTTTNFNLKNSASRGVYVDRTKQRVYELAYSPDTIDYATDDLTLLVPDLNEIGITRIGVQMKPDVRIHCVRSDGTVAMVVFDEAENVICWVTIETDGEVEDVQVIPGVVEDQVYYVVKRTINGSAKRYLEKWAKENECVGGALNKQADSFLAYSGSSTSTITGLSHLEGETVVAWGDGKDLGSYVVSAGSITLSQSVTSCIVGLTYEARFKGTKLGLIDGIGLTERRTLDQIGLLLRNTHYQGLQYGSDYTTLRDLPQVTGGVAQPADTIYSDYDEDQFALPGKWSTDERIHLVANAPRPAQVLACVMKLSAAR